MNQRPSESRTISSTVARGPNPGFTPGYVYSYSTFTQDAGWDELVLECNGVVIDRRLSNGAYGRNLDGDSFRGRCEREPRLLHHLEVLPSCHQSYVVTGAV